MKKKNIEFLISQKWLETLAPNFYQLSNFVENLKALGATDFDFLPKASKIANGYGRHVFNATHAKFGDNSSLLNIV